MKTQNFKNHARYYVLHHYIIFPLSLSYFILTLSKLDFSESLSENLLSIILAVLLILFPFLARIYALKNQNRIIRLEMRQRYFELSGKSFSEIESKLKLGQIIALRFAPDEELLDLIKQAQAEELSSKEIKSRIKNWKGDFHRV
ncbi:DUF6526 family protein [Algoriphagus sp. CAU 1675]|uniref:DUF6526 family protein n=1 Tax=Algoriphagus sp. CAU 1675 TaxID=3032597 RepID=UPI0023D9C3A4|nr:DUF6526 family protein [Algoriphagus sp. CAU 1675]MDF2157762.1 DUF6526 family protein [Algoriphagus sp. CAU 1675]